MEKTVLRQEHLSRCAFTHVFQNSEALNAILPLQLDHLSLFLILQGDVILQGGVKDHLSPGFSLSRLGLSHFLKTVGFLGGRLRVAAAVGAGSGGGTCQHFTQFLFEFQQFFLVFPNLLPALQFLQRLHRCLHCLALHTPVRSRLVRHLRRFSGLLRNFGSVREGFGLQRGLRRGVVSFRVLEREKFVGGLRCDDEGRVWAIISVHFLTITQLFIA